MILDACFLVDLLDGEDRAVAKLDEIEDELLSVPTLVYTEVGVGIDPESEVGRQFEAVIGRVSSFEAEPPASRSKDFRGSRKDDASRPERKPTTPQQTMDFSCPFSPTIINHQLHI